MAKFQLKLLTPQLNIQFESEPELELELESSSTAFLETTISEFYSQQNKNNIEKWNKRQYNYCYTFNEKVSFHLNGQKELNFSMIQNIWLDNELTINPFISKIKNGTQLLLIDQYNNEYFFIVKDIKYTLKDSNVQYDYSCQDSFTYQHIRQNSGYTISNNYEEEDFIGAKPLDWWARKIANECHISYRYIPLDQGLYISKETGNLVLFDKNTRLTQVEKIVKPLYLLDNKDYPQFEKYPEYYEEIPFAVSGSNASSALIALGDELGLMLNFKEHNDKLSKTERSNVFNRCFWFEPKKHEKTANLKYSPKVNIQSFGLSHSGSSLTTVLNVESNTFNDEVVTLLPDIPPFFNTLFGSGEWENSKYSEGYFTAICQNTTFLGKNGKSAEGIFEYSLEIEEGNGKSFFDSDNNYIYLHLSNAIKDNKKVFIIPLHYDRISLFNEQATTSMMINNYYYSANNTQMDFVVRKKDKDNNFYDVVYNDSYNPLTEEVQGTAQEECYLRVKLGFSYDSLPAIKNSIVLLEFYRHATTEELNFAYIADNCPWLENKLIDFSYFLKQNIISAPEYKALLNVLKNDLRIINGKLLYYTQEYYRAIQDKTETLVKLTNDLDSLGAAFNSEIVEVFKSKGSIEDIRYFSKAYDTFVAKYLKDGGATPIINYGDLLTEYINKCFSAQQRFLKNMYYFKQYFNQKVQLSTDRNIYAVKKWITFNELSNNVEDTSTGVTVITKNNQVIRRYLTFAKRDLFKSVTTDFKQYDPNSYESNEKIFKDDKITEVTTVHRNNVTDFHTYILDKTQMTLCTSTDGYSENQKYCRVAYVASLNSLGSENWPESFVYNEETWYKYKIDESQVWYASAKPVATYSSWDENITYTHTESDNTTKDVILSKDFLEVGYREIVSEYLYNKLYNEVNQEESDETTNETTSWAYHSEDTSENVNKWWNNDTIKNKLSMFNPLLLGGLSSEEDRKNSFFTNLFNSILNIGKVAKGSAEELEQIEFYKTHFPITSISYVGPNYVLSSYQWKDKNLTYQPANSNNDTYEDYLNYLKNTIIYKKKVAREIKSPFITSEYVSRPIPIVNLENESNFFRRVFNTTGTALYAGGIMLSVLNWNPLVKLAGAALSTYLWLNNQTIWSQSGINTEDFEGNPLKRMEDGNSVDARFEGYHDSDSVVYAKTTNSYAEWYELRTERGSAVNEVSGVSITTTNPDPNAQIPSITHQGTTYYISTQTHSSLYKDYFDYFSKIGLTYSSAKSIAADFYGNQSKNRYKKLTYQERYLRPMTANDLVDKGYKYKILKLDGIFNDDYDISDILESGNRFSTILYYFLDSACSSIDLSEIAEENIKWSEVKDANGNRVFSINGYEFTSQTSEDKESKFLIFREELFTREPIYYDTDWANGIISKNKRYSLYKSKDLFDANDIKINLQIIPNITEGFYRQITITGGYSKITSDTDVVWEKSNNASINDDRTKFYKQKDDGTFERAYSIFQIMDIGSYLFLDNDQYEIDTLDNVYQFKKIKVFLRQETYNKITKNGSTVYELDKQIDKTFTTEEYCSFDFTLDKENKTTISVECTDDDNNKYTRKCTLSSQSNDEGVMVSNISNGTFWYLYNNRTDCPQLFEVAAVIESELTIYWQQAYNASLLCDYFLPPSWQPRSLGDINYFNKNIICFNNNKATLSSQYIPDVCIYSVGKTSRFPRYELKYKTTSIDSEEDNTVKSASDILQENTVYVDFFNSIGESISNYIITNYNSVVNSDFNKVTYYYNNNHESTGTKWKHFLHKHTNNATVFEEYDGLYVMTYKTLRKQFSEKPAGSYEQYRTQQQALWNDLYKQYPCILLEESFKNETATSSLDLFTLAKNAFKDKQEPERSYNISLINAYNTLLVKPKYAESWTKYQGQELKIGEGILVDVEEYYNNIDDVYKSLSQYLFITDVSYDLRKDSDIQVTVNTIKYQDKLIQRLVKLIK